MNSTQDFTLDVHVLAQKKWDIHGPKMNSSIPEKWEGHKLSTRPSSKVAMIFGCVRWVWTMGRLRYKITWFPHIWSTHINPSWKLFISKNTHHRLGWWVTVPLEVSTKNISLSQHIRKTQRKTDCCDFALDILAFWRTKQIVSSGQMLLLLLNLHLSSFLDGILEP